MQENEHVEVHEVRGFMSENLMGAMKEARTMAKGARCNRGKARPVRSASLVLFHEEKGRRQAHLT